MTPKVKICCIQSEEEARLAISNLPSRLIISVQLSIQRE